MCGLVGIAGDTTGSWKDVYSHLLLLDSLRGLHSTGAGFVSRLEESFLLAKRVGDPFNLFNAKEYLEAMEPKNSWKVILGHNRHATLGEKTESNAHPFAFEHVMGMHNGTLDKSSVKDLHDYDKFGTDSEAIFATINEIGLDETAKKLAGAWALIWFDKRDSKLNFLRNDKRPLHYCYSADRCTLIWASELDMLKYVLERNHKKVHEDKFYVTTKDTLYSWDIPPATNGKFEIPEQREVEGRKWVWEGPLQHGNGGKKTSGTIRYGTTIGTSYRGSNTSDTIAPFLTRRNTSKFRPPYKDQYCRVINKKEFFPMVNEGCCMCGQSGQKWGEFIHVLGHYAGYATPYLCEDCFNQEDTYDLVKYAV